MLGPAAASAEAATPARQRRPPQPGRRRRARLSARSLGAARNLRDVSFDLHAGEVLGLVALEGQGQDELFDILCGPDTPGGGRDAGRWTAPVQLRHPADAIRAGIVLVPADRRRRCSCSDRCGRTSGCPRSPRAALGPGERERPRSRRVAGGDRAAADRHARAVRGAATVGRQPAEGHDRALAGERRAHLPLLRPDPRASTSARSARSTSSSASWRPPVRRSCCSPRSWRRSSASATAPSSSSAGRVVERCRRRARTSRRCCARPMACRRPREMLA